MARQSQAQQAIGFSIGTNATAPDYLILGRQFTNELSSTFDQVMAVFGNRDNMYEKHLTGYEGSSISITLPLDTRICPVIIAAAGKVATTGTDPAYTNVIDPFNTNYLDNLSIDGTRLTFFFYDAEVGMIKQTGKLANEYSITTEADQVNMEIDFLGGEQTILEGADLTTAEAGFVIEQVSEANLAAFPVTGAAKTVYLAEDTQTFYVWNGTSYIVVGGASGYGILFRPGDLVVRYANDVAMTTPTIVNADFGLSLTVMNNVQEEPKTVSTAGSLVFPVSYLGQFGASIEFTADVITNDLYNRYLVSTPTAFEFKFSRGGNILNFVTAPTVIETVTGDKVADSDEPVKQTITIEKARNAITHPSLRITANLATNLEILINV